MHFQSKMINVLWKATQNITPVDLSLKNQEKRWITRKNGRFSCILLAFSAKLIAWWIEASIKALQAQVQQWQSWMIN